MVRDRDKGKAEGLSGKAVGNWSVEWWNRPVELSSCHGGSTLCSVRGVEAQVRAMELSSGYQAMLDALDACCLASHNDTRACEFADSYPDTALAVVMLRELGGRGSARKTLWPW